MIYEIRGISKRIRIDVLSIDKIIIDGSTTIEIYDCSAIVLYKESFKVVIRDNCLLVTPTAAEPLRLSEIFAYN